MPPENPVAQAAPDWTREVPTRFWDPSRRLLRAVRRYQHWRAQGGLWGAVFRRRWAASHRFWSAITGADVPLNCHLGGGLLIPHPNGIVIHPDAVVGNNCLLFQQVTIGQQAGGVPTLGDHVDVGAGAKILGKVSVGSHVQVGANAVVLHDVPSGVTVVGIPAKVVGRLKPDEA
jgi:serine O-acetyltransferase